MLRLVSPLESLRCVRLPPPPFNTGVVFTTSVGTPLEPRNVNRHFYDLLTNSKISHFRLHDLRHYCASLLLAQGVQLKIVSEILGHAQLSTTADIYTHILPEVKKDALNLMDRILTAK